MGLGRSSLFLATYCASAWYCSKLYFCVSGLGLIFPYDVLQLFFLTLIKVQTGVSVLNLKKHCNVLYFRYRLWTCGVFRLTQTCNPALVAAGTVSTNSLIAAGTVRTHSHVLALHFRFLNLLRTFRINVG